MKFISIFLFCFSILLTNGCDIGSLKPKAFITQDDGIVTVLSIPEHAVIDRISVGSHPTGTCVSPDGKKVFVTNQDSDTVSVIDAKSHKVLSTFNAPHNPSACAVGTDGNIVYVASAGGVSGTEGNNVFAFDVQTGKVVWKTSAIDGPTGIAIAKDGRTVYLTSYQMQSLFSIDAQSGEILDYIYAGGPADSIVVSPDGKSIYVAFHLFAGFVREYNADDFSEVTRIKVGEGPRGMDISPDGKLLCVANQGTFNPDSTVSIISTGSKEVVKTLQVGGDFEPEFPGENLAEEPETLRKTGSGPVGVSFGPEGKYVYVTCEYTGTVSVIDTEKLEVVTSIQVGRKPYSYGRFISPPPRPTKMP